MIVTLVAVVGLFAVCQLPFFHKRHSATVSVLFKNERLPPADVGIWKEIKST